MVNSIYICAILNRSQLLKVIAKSVSPVSVLLKQDFTIIHADINPNSILLSSVDSLVPTVKVDSSGFAATKSYNDVRIKTLESRPPEAWQSIPPISGPLASRLLISLYPRLYLNRRTSELKDLQRRGV